MISGCLNFNICGLDSSLTKARKNNEQTSSCGKTMFKIKHIDLFFVTLQLTALGIFIYVSHWRTHNILLDFLLGAGIFLGIWAIFAADPRKVNVRPRPHPRGELVTTGPFRLIRHPMYTAQLLVTLAWAINEMSQCLWLLWVFYVAVIVVKLQYEEGHLQKQFPDYQAYRKKTKRLIPFIF